MIYFGVKFHAASCAGDGHALCVHDHDIIANLNAGSKGGFMLAEQDVGNVRCKAA